MSQKKKSDRQRVYVVNRSFKGVDEAILGVAESLEKALDIILEDNSLPQDLNTLKDVKHLEIEVFPGLTRVVVVSRGSTIAYDIMGFDLNKKVEVLYETGLSESITSS
jgi:hypothetical protein